MHLLMNSRVFWDITPCRVGMTNLCFGRAYCTHLQGQVALFLNCPTMKMEIVRITETSATNSSN
jgi:hypothetical protein